MQSDNLENINLDIIFKKEKSKQDEAYEAIKQMIIMNKLTPGTPLIERQLSELLNISRTPIRAALRELVNENLVSFYPGIGMVVSSIRLEDVIEIYEIREVLDALAIRLFLRTNNVEKIDEMRNHVQSMKEALDRQDFQMVVRHDIEFHNCYLDNTGNARLGNIMISLHDQINRFLSLTSNDEEKCIRSYNDHKRVIEAIDDGDYAKAEKMMNEHIINNREYHLSRLTKY